MLKKHLLLTAFCVVAAQTAHAIEPEFNGDNGILAGVFQSNCLACHSSTRSGSARNGAPAGLNWDDYGTVVANFDRIVTRAITQKTMPPAFSGIPTLSEAQQDALLDWQEAGFPEDETQVSMIVPQYEGGFGILEQVFAINCLGCHSSTRSGGDRNGAPAGLNWDDYASAAAHGDRIIARAVTLKTMPPAFSGVPTLDMEQQNALLAWQAAGYPAVLPGTVSGASFDFISQELTLPVVIVGADTYEARLRMIPMPNTPSGLGFEVFSAIDTEATSDKAVTYTPDTGAVVIPEVILLNGSGNQPSDRVSAEMRLVADSPLLQFEVTVLTYLNP